MLSNQANIRRSFLRGNSTKVTTLLKGIDQAQPLEDTSLTEVLKDEALCHSLINAMPLEWIANNKRIRNVTSVATSKAKERNQIIKLNNQYLGIGVLSGILLPEVINRAKRDTALYSLTDNQVNAMLYAWCHSRVNYIVFTLDNILPYYYSRLKRSAVRLVVRELVGLGYVQEVSYSEVFKLTGLLQGRKQVKYYRISRNGEALMLRFFKYYFTQFEKLTKAFYNVDLLRKMTIEDEG
tara:strand:+ start:3156 stop:3869 length:714 start_codon:yes stop_codon:yes gene_type:complete